MGINLKVNGVEAQIAGFDKIDDIVRVLPDIPEMSDLFHEFAKSSSERIRTRIAHHDNLRPDTIKLLLNDASNAVLESVLNTETVYKYITLDNVERVFATNFNEAISNLIDLLGKLENEEETFNRIIELAVKNKDPQVRYNLAKRTGTNMKLQRILAKDLDADVANEAKTNLNGDINPYRSRRR
ncbi:MAG: hypothetical protein NT007_06465 [Candidatus Kapabacteria bacterium]|nr:hypothetical protein [Candidatus Kapabacteria bacterium]